VSVFFLCPLSLSEKKNAERKETELLSIMRKQKKKIKKIYMLLPGETRTSNNYSKKFSEHLCRMYYSTTTDPEGIHSAPAHSTVDLPKRLQ